MSCRFQPWPCATGAPGTDLYAAIGLPVIQVFRQNLVATARFGGGKQKRMQLPDKCLAYVIAGFDEILQKAECIAVSRRLQMILERLHTALR